MALYRTDENGKLIKIAGNISLDNTNTIVKLLENKVDKVQGKTLSTNDYTTEEKTKLQNIDFGANKTIVDSEFSIDSTNPVQNSTITNFINSLFNTIYPIGMIIMNTSGINPGTLYGGTWQLYAKGRTIIGVDDNNSNYQINKTGGSETVSYTPKGTTKDHTLTEDEIPSHEHIVTDPLNNRWLATGSTAGDVNGKRIDGLENTAYAVDNTHTLKARATGGSQPHNHDWEGSTENINILQPYIVTYIWERIQ